MATTDTSLPGDVIFQRENPTHTPTTATFRPFGGTEGDGLVVIEQFLAYPGTEAARVYMALSEIEALVSSARSQPHLLRRSSRVDDTIQEQDQ